VYKGEDAHGQTGCPLRLQEATAAGESCSRREHETGEQRGGKASAFSTRASRWPASNGEAIARGDVSTPASVARRLASSTPLSHPARPQKATARAGWGESPSGGPGSSRGSGHGSRTHALEARWGAMPAIPRRPPPAGARTPRSASSTGAAARTRKVCDSCARAAHGFWGRLASVSLAGVTGTRRSCEARPRRGVRRTGQAVRPTTRAAVDAISWRVSLSGQSGRVVACRWPAAEIAQTQRCARDCRIPMEPSRSSPI
jgi:hypothetical protein